MMPLRLRLAGLLLAWLVAGCNLTAAPETAPATYTPGEPRLVVAWAESGNLIVWQQGEALPRRIASGGVIRPFIAPDGQHIAFTRGPGGAPDTLWVMDMDGTAEQKLVGDGRPSRYQEGQMQIGDVVWLDESVLYFNTLRQQAPAFAPMNDLYRAHIRTREVALLLGPGDGGRIYISPDKQKIALVAAGTYGEQNGRIRVVDPLAQDEPRDLLYFIGVATGSHYPFYPPVYWLPDNSAVVTAIPDKDLVYSETGPAEAVPVTTLWRLPVETPSRREIIGQIRASFFGLPRLSDDGLWMTYMQREPQTNRFNIILANQQGRTFATVAGGEAGQIEQPQWLPGTLQFIYAADTMGRVYMASPETSATKLSEEVVFSPLFVSPELYVFATPAAIAADGVQLRFACIGEASQKIGTAARIPVLDAKLVLPENLQGRCLCRPCQQSYRDGLTWNHQTEQHRGSGSGGHDREIRNTGGHPRRFALTINSAGWIHATDKSLARHQVTIAIAIIPPFSRRKPSCRKLRRESAWKVRRQYRSAGQNHLR